MNIHKRNKMGMLPGDIPKRSKIRMLEKKGAVISFGGGYVQVLNKAASKSFLKILRMKERARQKERDRAECEQS